MAVLLDKEVSAIYLGPNDTLAVSYEGKTVAETKPGQIAPMVIDRVVIAKEDAHGMKDALTCSMGKS